jgi:heme-degrading monooxygenase HmoA
MFVRLTFIKFSPEAVDEAKRVYKQEVIPAVRKQKGNVNIRLLEPTERSDDFISLTEWETKADAEAYDASGLYKQLVNRLKEYFTKTAVLKTYTTEDVLITSH